MGNKRKRLTKKGKEENPTVHEELKGLSVKVDEEGKFVLSKDLDEINEFLTRHVKDRKLAHIQEEGETEAEDTEDSTEEAEAEETDNEEEGELEKRIDALLNSGLDSETADE